MTKAPYRVWLVVDGKKDIVLVTANDPASAREEALLARPGGRVIHVAAHTDGSNAAPEGHGAPLWRDEQ